MLWERRNITRNAVCRLKPEPRSLDISPQQVCWTQRWGDNTKCFAGKKRVYIYIYCKFMQIPNVLSEIPTFGNPNAWAICFIDLPKAQPWTFARLHGPSVVRVMWNWTALTSKGFKTRKLKFIFIPNLYQIYTNLIQFIQRYFPHHFLVRRRRRDVKNPDTFAFDRFIPPTLLYNTPSPRFSTALLSKTSLQPHSALLYTTSNTFLRHSSTTVLYNALRK